MYDARSSFLKILTVKVVFLLQLLFNLNYYDDILKPWRWYIQNGCRTRIEKNRIPPKFAWIIR